ncbi:MAG: Hsp33 family molecular chaperone HslO [Mariprofundaceae bacterium]
MVASADHLIRFMLPAAHSRGAIVRASAIHAEAGRIHGLSGQPHMLLTKTLVASCLLHSVSKGGVRHVLQIDGEDGPVQRVMAEAGQGKVRGYMRWRDDGARLSPSGKEGELGWLGSGVKLACVRDLGFGQPYISRTEADSPYLADVLVNYLQRSVQVRADILLHKELGLMIEAMPGCDDEHWFEAAKALAAIKDLDKPIDSILEGFSALACTVVAEDDLVYACGCNPKAMAATLMSMDPIELAELRDEDGNITVSCRYCDKSYAIKA